MLNVNKYKTTNGKIWLPCHITKNMSNYVRLFGLQSSYIGETGLFNIYINPDLVVTYYTTKDFANVYHKRRASFKLKGWLNVLRYLSTMRGK